MDNITILHYLAEITWRTSLQYNNNFVDCFRIWSTPFASQLFQLYRFSLPQNAVRAERFRAWHFQSSFSLKCLGACARLAWQDLKDSLLSLFFVKLAFGLKTNWPLLYNKYICALLLQLLENIPMIFHYY